MTYPASPGIVARSGIPRSAGLDPARMDLRQIHGTMLSHRATVPQNVGLLVIRHPRTSIRGPGNGGQGRRRYQIVGTGVPAGAGFLVDSPGGIACRLMTGKMPVPPKKGLLRNTPSQWHPRPSSKITSLKATRYNGASARRAP